MTQEVGLQPNFADLVREGANAAYEAADIPVEEGARDVGALRERIFEVLQQHKVLSWAERTSKAITRGALVAQLFPGLVTPDHFAEEEDPDLAQAIWGYVSKDVWTQLATGSRGPIQQMVGSHMGNGYVLVRTKLTPDNTDAVYVTDDRTCIEKDYLAIDNRQLQRLFDTLAGNRSMLIMRQPEHARRYAGGFDRLTKALGGAAHERLALAIEAATAGDEDSDGDGPDDN